MHTVNLILLLCGMLLFVSVLASTLSARLGLPLLLLFLLVGMLAGEDGPGQIQFDDFSTANFVGQLALAVILLDGGLRTRFATLRVGFLPAVTLASWGVIATSLILGAFATWLFDVDWRFGLLLAAVVGSTDAAAVFSLLRNSGVRLNDRVKATLEVESGANDPMAIMMVTVLVAMLMMPGERDGWAFAVMLVQQIGFGLAAGLIGGFILAALMFRLHLPEGLYALLIVSGGLFIFAVTNITGGSGFLAVYVAGLIVGNRRSHATEHVLRVMDGLAWLSQAGLFLILGLLVTPSTLAAHAAEAVAMALFLMFVARPLAVLSCVFPFRFSRRELIYISWVGLRGAVPIVLAIYPLTMGVPEARLIFEVAFAVVLVSLLVQGATVPVAARWLGVVVPPRDEPEDRMEVWLGHTAAVELLQYRVGDRSRAEGAHPDALAQEHAGEEGRCVAVLRDGAIVPVNAQTRLHPGDLVWLIAAEERAGSLANVFAVGREGELSPNAGFFGEFVIAAEGLAGDLSAAYGFELGKGESELSLAELIRRRLGRSAVEGDRIAIGGFVLSVRDTDSKGRIVRIGLKCP